MIVVAGVAVVLEGVLLEAEGGLVDGLNLGPEPEWEGVEETEREEAERGKSGTGFVSRSSPSRVKRSDWEIAVIPQELKVASDQETMPNS